RAAFLVAAALCLAGIAFALSIRDVDAAGTIPARRRPRPDRPETALASPTDEALRSPAR
ncbi:MAG: hypothetical protein QOG76_7587, partial [Pseudonocardiales bacterium]|nr:hypothetical protein [Pseudonocardiales bacterium]